MNELVYEDLVLLINTSSSVRKVAFGFVRNAKGADYMEGNCKIAWERLISNYAPNTALSLLKLKSEFHNSNLRSIQKDPDKWISNWKGFE